MYSPKDFANVSNHGSRSMIYAVTSHPQRKTWAKEKPNFGSSFENEAPKDTHIHVNMRYNIYIHIISINIYIYTVLYIMVYYRNVIELLVYTHIYIIYTHYAHVCMDFISLNKYMHIESLLTKLKLLSFPFLVSKPEDIESFASLPPAPSWMPDLHPVSGVSWPLDRQLG